MTQNTESAAPLTLAVPSTMKSLLEALIFAASEPVAVLQLKAMIEESAPPAEQRTLETTEIERTVEALNADYTAANRPYRIIAVAGGYQFATMPEYAAWISRLYRDRLRRKLSQSALESLAIIAYRQPISKPEIEQIRGVNCDYVLKTLLEKELVTITGRAETVGRPLLYGTTKEFLMHFGLNSITDLPRPREIEEILGESHFETERRMLEAQAAAEATRREAEEFPSRLPHIPKRKAEMAEQVEIVHKRRVRQIRVRPAADKETSELPFGETATEVPAPEREPEAAEVISVSMPEVPAAEVFESPSPADVPPSEELAHLAMENTVEPAELTAIEPTHPALENTGERAELAEVQPAPEPLEEPVDRPVKPPLVATPLERPAPEEPHPGLWKSWKEKIQSFIRKIFG